MTQMFIHTLCGSVVALVLPPSSTKAYVKSDLMNSLTDINV